MRIFKNIFFLLFFLIISINSINAQEKVSYIDIDYILTSSVAGKLLLNKLKEDEDLKINIFKLKDEDFKKKKNKVLAKKNLISKEEINKELKSLQNEFNKYRNNKIKQFDELKAKRNRNILNFLNLLNPIIEKYMSDNSIYMLIDKKNIFIASKDYDITNNIIELINNQIKNIEIK
ncbi:OmpH family outer membrane protein [Candidatus Pelagibacter sp.]|nr:OmpH family outer membrane protein [Candidatus Pelagibacter sp.]